MTLQQLEYFLATVAHGSFSAAAQDLHLAQPSLSEQVRRLEAELGVALFRRVGHGLVLTEAGGALRPHAEAALGAVAAARDAVAGVRELRGGTASFGAFGTARTYLGADLVADFRALHPDVRVRLLGQNSSETVRAIRSGELEAGVVALPIDDTGLEVHPAMRDELLYVSTDPARLRGPMTIEALARAPLILSEAKWGAQDPTRRQLVTLAQQAGLALEPVVDVEDVEVALDLTARGVGDTVAARANLRGAPRRVGWVPFAEPLFDTFALVWRRDARLSPATRELVALTEARLATLGRELARRSGRRRRPA